MTSMERAYRDLVALEAKGKAPEGTRHRLLADPQRWFSELRIIQQELSAQLDQRQAELEDLKSECFALPEMNGRERYAEHRAEFLRWRGGMKAYRGRIDARLTEVAALCKQHNRDNWQVEAVEEWKTMFRDLVAAVSDVLAVPEDESIPSELWNALEAAYDALPVWAHHTEKYRTRDQVAAD